MQYAKKEINVIFAWDDEAHVWMATSQDVYGLVMEHSSFGALVERVRYGIMDLLEEGQIFEDISLNFDISRIERLVMSG